MARHGYAERLGGVGMACAAELVVANRPPDVVSVPLGEVVGRIKTVPLDSDLVKTARALGVSLGD